MYWHRPVHLCVLAQLTSNLLYGTFVNPLSHARNLCHPSMMLGLHTQFLQGPPYCPHMSGKCAWCACLRNVHDMCMHENIPTLVSAGAFHKKLILLALDIVDWSFHWGMPDNILSISGYFPYPQFESHCFMLWYQNKWGIPYYLVQLLMPVRLSECTVVLVD